MVDDINVNIDNVDIGIENADKVTESINKASSSVLDAQSSLDSDINIPSFSSIISDLGTSLSRCKILIGKLNDYKDDTVNFEKQNVKRFSGESGLETDSESEKISVDNETENIIETPEIKTDDDNKELTSDEQELINSLFTQNDGTNISLEDFKKKLEKIKTLTQEDKDYVSNQLDKGNIRAAVQYLNIIIGEQNYEDLKSKNNAKIEELENEIDKIREKNNYSTTMSVEDESLIDKYNRQINVLDAQIKAKKRALNQYKISNIEWEYDYLFKLIGTDDFENTIFDYYFYSAANEYYNSDSQHEKILTAGPTSEEALFNLLLNDNSSDSFISWLNSDSCTLENKEKYIEFYNKNYLNSDKSIYDCMSELGWNGWLSLGISEFNYYLTDDEKKVLAYLYKTTEIDDRDDVIDQFMDDFRQSRYQREGMSLALSAFESILNGSDNGTGVLSANWEGIKIGTKGWFSRIGEIADKNGVITAEEYATMYLNNILCGMSYFMEINTSKVNELDISNEVKAQINKDLSEGKKVTYLDVALLSGTIDQETYNQFNSLVSNSQVKEFIERNSSSGLFGISHMDWLNYSYNAGVATGTMLPSIVMSITTSGALSGLSIGDIAIGTSTLAELGGKFAGLATMFAYSYSTNKSSAIREGHDLDDAVLYSLLSASGETISEFFIGAVPFVSKGSEWIKITANSKVSTILFKTILNLFVVAPGQEIAQELFEDNIWHPLSELAAYGETDYKFSLEDCIKTALTTYISTFELQGVSVIIPTVGTIAKKNSTALSITIDGEIYDLTYGEVLECVDENTNELSQSKLGEMLADKIMDRFTNIEISNDVKVTYTEDQISAVESVFDSYDNGKNNSSVINKLKETYLAQMNNGNPYIMSEIASTIQLLDAGIKIEITTDGKSHYSNSEKTISINVNDLNNPSTLIHEFMHAKHNFFHEIETPIYLSESLISERFSTGNVPVFNSTTNSFEINDYNYSEVVQKTREKVMNSDNVLWKLKKLYELQVANKAIEYLKAGIEAKGVVTVDEAVNSTLPKIEEMINKNGIEYVLNRYGINFLYEGADMEITDELKIYITEIYMSTFKATGANESFYTRASNELESNSTFTKVQDIVDSVMGGTYSSDANFQGHGGGHGVNYYGGLELNSFTNSRGVMQQFKEAVVQFESVMSYSPDALPILYEIFGDEYCDMVMSEVNAINAEAASYTLNNTGSN